MNTKTLAILLLALFVVSSLEVVWAYDAFDSEDFEESEDVSVNDVSEIEEDDFDILSKGSCKGEKVKSREYVSGRCLTSGCKKTCKNDGFKNGKCYTSEKSGAVKECYCIKDCHKKHKKHDTSPPVSPPSVTPDFPPMDAPNSPANSPSVSPDLPPFSGKSPIINSFDNEDFEESEDVSVNDVSEIEEDDFDILSKGACKGKKVKSRVYQSGRCVTSKCKETCKRFGFKIGKCYALEKSDKVKKCYCFKDCHKKHKKHDPSTPASPPSPTPDVPPTKTPNSYTSLEDDDSDIEFP